VEQRFAVGVYLMTMGKEIKIDTVQMMRDIREKLSEKLRGLFYSKTKREPLIVPVVIDIRN